MLDPLITLTTDFGEDSPYVAAVKGVILSVNPRARLIDLSHQIPPQGVGHAAFFLAEALPYFPAGTVHVVVVDPGVGGERAVLLVEAAGQRVLAPDNGCLTEFLRPLPTPPVVRRVTEARFWRPSVSSTFHGRDIFAPVAGHLSLGVSPDQFGPLTDSWVRLERPEACAEGADLVGEVVFVDHFGNLISNIPAGRVERPPERIEVAGSVLPDCRWVRTYADVEPGRLVALTSSAGLVEVAVAQGSAEERLRAGVGTAIRLVGCRR
jgi:S-adenosylmethionine hydrolase